MMKKLISIFLGCLMITCAFTACGDKNEENSSPESSASDNTTADDDTENDEETSDEEDESESEKSDKTENDDEDNDGEAENDNDEAPVEGVKDKNLLYGKWHTDYTDQIYLNIENDHKAAFCMEQDFSYQFFIDGDENFNFGGEVLTKDDYDFDGKKLVLHFETDNDLTMTKTDPSDSSIFGEYVWESGAAYEAIVEGYNFQAEEDEKITENGMKLLMNCVENSTTFTVNLPIGFELDDEKIVLSSEMIFGDDSSYNCDYRVNGDELVLISDIGNEMIFIRYE